MDSKKQYVENAQLRLFDSMWLALQREEAELREQYHVARNLACSTWSDVCNPSPCGGTSVLSPTAIIPHHTKLLQDNYDMLREDISKRRYVLLKTFKKVLKKANRNTKDDGCYKYWSKKRSWK